jgi:hypothetical protein
VRKRDRLILPDWAPWLVLLPIAMMFVGDQINTHFGWQEELSDLNPDRPSPRYEAIGRMRMLAALLPFMLTSILIALFFAREFATFMGPQMRRKLMIAIGLFAASAAFFLYHQATGSSPAEGKMLGEGFLDSVFRPIKASTGPMEWAVWITGQQVALVAVLHVLVFIFSICLILGAGSVIVGIISCLASAPRRRPLKVRRHYHDLQRRRIDLYLYASAFLMVTGLFFMDSAFRWPAAFAADRELYMDHVDALMLNNGIYYSMILVSYYVPAALLMRRFSARTPAAAPAAPVEEGRSTIVDRLSPSRLIKALLALIAPAVAGILTQVVEGAGF